MSDGEPTTATEAEPRSAASALERSQAARRRRVLDATLRLAETGGFDAVQMRDVAAEADVAVGTVYRYFVSKEQLLVEAMAEQQETLLARVKADPPTADTAAERVADVLSRANRSLQRHPHVTAAMVRAHGSCRPELADLVGQVGRTMTETITFAIDPQRAAPSPRDERVARVLVLAWLSSLIGWVSGAQGPEGVDADLASAAHLLLDR